MTLAQGGFLFLAHPRIGIFFTHFLPHRVGDAAVLRGARAFAVADFAGMFSAAFRGVWLLARWILLFAAQPSFYMRSLPQSSIETVVKQRRARAGTRCSRRYRHAAALRPLLRYYGGAPAPLAGRWLCLYSCVSVLNDAILERWVNRYIFFWNLLGMAAFSRLPALVEAGRFAAALHKRPPVRCS